MSDLPGFIENIPTGDNVDDSQRDENVILYSHWQRICAVGIVAGSVGCIAWLQLAASAMDLNSNEVEILESVGKNIASSLDNVSRAIIESAKILANKMSGSYDHSEMLFTSLQALDLSQEYLIECYDFLTEHEAAANKLLGVPHQFRKKMLTRIMNAAYVSK